MGGSTKLSQGWFYLQPVSGSIQAGVVMGLGTKRQGGREQGAGERYLLPITHYQMTNDK